MNRKVSVQVFPLIYSVRLYQVGLYVMFSALANVLDAVNCGVSNKFKINSVAKKNMWSHLSLPRFFFIINKPF